MAESSRLLLFSWFRIGWSGAVLFSSPLASYGGICAGDSEAEQALLEFLKRQAQEQQVDYLELRNPVGGTLPGFVANPRYSSFSMALSNDPDAVLKSLPKDIRYMIRKAEKADLHVRRGPERLDEFYKLFAINMRRLGTPVFPRALFANLLEQFGKQSMFRLSMRGRNPWPARCPLFFATPFTLTTLEACLSRGTWRPTTSSGGS